MKKIYTIMFLTCFLLISFVGISSIHANSYAMSTEDIGYYDCWLHADGKTWQNGVKPSSTITHTFTIAVPIDTSKKLKSYNVSYLSNKQGKYKDKYYKYAVDNGRILDYKYLGNGEMQYTIRTTLRANEVIDGKDITRQDQAKLVQGKRFYMPVLIKWEYEESSGDGDFGIRAGHVDTYCIDSNGKSSKISCKEYFEGIGDSSTGLLYVYQKKTNSGRSINRLLYVEDCRYNPAKRIKTYNDIKS